MVSQLGSVVEVKRHCGWTGNTETSWKTIDIAQSSKEIKRKMISFLFELDTNINSKTLAEINGDDSILYWVDLTTEMAFYLPQQFSSLLFFLSIYYIFDEF